MTWTVFLKHALVWSLFSLPYSSFALEFAGQWEGRGTCYLQSRVGASSVCDYTAHIVAKDTLQIRVCVRWYQQWGSANECWESEYGIQTDGALWIRERSGLIRNVGQLTDTSMDVDYEIAGGRVTETFRLQGNDLVLKNDYQSSGKQWLYSVSMKRSRIISTIGF